MKKLHIGVDIIEIDRIGKAISRWGDHFLRRIYTVRELEAYQGKVESLAARFAAKEAVIKAISDPNTVISWLEIEILTELDGRPTIHLNGQALDQAQKLGLRGIEISLSHSRENAIALVIGIKED